MILLLPLAYFVCVTPKFGRGSLSEAEREQGKISDMRRDSGVDRLARSTMQYVGGVWLVCKKPD